MTKKRNQNQAFYPVDFSRVVIEDGFWTPRIETNRQKSLWRQFRHLRASGALDNFKRAAGETGGEFQGLFFSDSDVYKWLEASCYSLKTNPDPELEALVEEVIGLVAAAQEPCGYLNTYFQLVEPDKKFTNFGVCHELYTGGHLIQAGIAHFEAAGKTALLAVACRYANHLVNVFGPGKLEAFDGHAGIEMALITLGRLQENQDYRALAEFFLDQRGRPDSRLRWELAHLGEIAGKPGKPGQNNSKFFGSVADYDGRHAQDHLPVRRQNEVVGHAVRAVYLYCGMADLAVETGDSELVAALEQLWRHLTARRMYVTGGIGPSRMNEGFTRDYDLPNDLACAESCAAASMVMWNYRMLNLNGAGRYADLMERVLYNAFLVGVSLDGEKYFYNNPLQSNGDLHREEWYECACCPPNIARVLASLGGYIFSRTPRGLAVHLYISSQISLDLDNGQNVRFRQETRYPWEGNVRITVATERQTDFELLLRIPEWCQAYTIKMNHETIKPMIRNGYAAIARGWEDGDNIELDLEMPVLRLQSHPAVSQNAGKTALQRGPVVYCLEEADNHFPIEQMILPEKASLSTGFLPDILGGVAVIEGEAFVPDLKKWDGKLYRHIENQQDDFPVKFRAIPYYGWDNREPGKMTVWLNATK